MPEDPPPLHLTLPGTGRGHTAHHTDYRAAELGRVTLEAAEPLVAGAFAALTLVFTAGRFGMDDTGSLRLCTRQISDLATPQFADPKAANYVSAEASNGAVLTLSFDPKLALRPFSRTLTVAVARGFLRPGETITVRLGDRRHGSPGLRLQTYCESAFRIVVLADVFATCNWALLEDQPTLPIGPGPAATHRAVLPTLRRPGQEFALGLRADDAWGNPTDALGGEFRLRASATVAGLPERFAWPQGARAHRIEGLSAPDDVTIDWLDATGAVLATSNTMAVADSPLLPFWADLHGQSGETIGTGTARELVAYGRDHAFLDAMCHQGNDFQITGAFWRALNALTAESDVPGRFVFFPGWEWSGNTGLGGDRNVIHREEGGTLHRSCHALVEDLSDAATDCDDAAALHAALRADGRATLCVPHVGGRYADLRVAHDRMLERSVEVHSDWGTFDWLLEDAFAVGARVGIVANSDGHKGRQGASHPGASQFGSYGGLTCILAEALSRPALWDALLRRHHYATTNGRRLHLDVRAALMREAQRHRDDPALGGPPEATTRTAMMGDILTGVADPTANFTVTLAASAPLERLELRNRESLLETLRPYAAADLGRRIRVVWEGSEYRGRGRETLWQGTLGLEGNTWRDLRPINRFNVERPFIHDAQSLRFAHVTTGGFGGVEAMLDDPQAGVLRIALNQVEATLPIGEIGYEDRVFECGGLGRRLRAYRLPDANPHRAFTATRSVTLRPDADNALFVRATFEDGTVAWSSPIYLIAGDGRGTP